MEPVFFVMAILGCGDGNADCREARLDTAHYATAAQCRAAMPVALTRHTDLDYPVIAANCRASGPVIAGAGARSPRG